MATINKKILVLGYLAKVGDKTAYDIARTLGLDHAYVHRIVRQMADEGHLRRLDPIINEKGVQAKPVRITLSGLREIFLFIMNAEQKKEHPYHAGYGGSLAQGTATLREIIAGNTDLHPALPIYLCFFDGCADELFKPDPDEEEQYRNARWASSLAMIVRALISALPGEAYQEANDPDLLISHGHQGVESPASPQGRSEDPRGREPSRESDYWEQLAGEQRQEGTFGADLFFALESVVSEIREISSASGRRYGITGFFSDDIVPLFKPFEEEIAARIIAYEKRGARLSQVRHRMACIDPGSFECIPGRGGDQVGPSSWR